MTDKPAAISVIQKGPARGALGDLLQPVFDIPVQTLLHGRTETGISVTGLAEIWTRPT